jgi:hypothetical protein
MSVMVNEERLPNIPAGASVTIRKDYDGGPYIVRGRLIGFELSKGGPVIRVLPEDGLERKVPMPARVTVDG